MNTLSKRTCAALATALALAAPAYPWGKEGHEAIALVASQNLSADARSHVVKILGNDDLASIAVWMDELRSAHFHAGPLGSDPEALKFDAQFPKNYYWHFVDLPLGTKAYTLDGPFTDPEDVVHMAEAAVAVLEGGGDKRITKREALYMLVHFVGDEHQPLHVGNGYYELEGSAPPKLVTDVAAAQGLPNDRGGNSLFFGPGRYDELHGYWDVALVTKVAHGGSMTELAAIIGKDVAASGAGWKSSGDYHHWPEQWATQSLEAARIAYSGLIFGAATLDAKGGIKKIQITLPKGYDETCIPLAELRLGQAAYHLAEILNSVKWPD